MQLHTVLEILLYLVERIVLIDVFHIRHQTAGHVVSGNVVSGFGRVAFHSVILLITIENRLPCLIVICPSIVVEVIPSRIVDRTERICTPLVQNIRRYDRGQAGYVLRICREVFFLCRRKSVKADVLFRSCSGSIIESVTCTLTFGHLAPYRGLYGSRIIVDGHTVFEKLLFVFQNFFGDFSQIDIHRPPLGGFFVVDEGIEKPKLYVLDIGCFEVALIYLAHNTAPVGLRVGQMTVRLHIHRIEVVWATLRRIIGHQQRVQIAVHIVRLIAIREKLGGLHFADIMVGELFEVIFQVSGHTCGILSCEYRINVEPR